MANGRTVSNATANVVVVAADADRLGQYEAALREARVPTRATLDADSPTCRESQARCVP